LGNSSAVEKLLKGFAANETPKRPACGKCGGSVMTPTYDFAEAKKGYKVEWEDVHNSPLEYAVFGWAKAHKQIKGTHVLFRMTINDGKTLSDQSKLGDRTLMVTVNKDSIVGHTFSYDIKG